MTQSAKRSPWPKLALAFALIAPACGSLDTPTEPPPEQSRPDPVPQASGSLPPPVFGAPAPSGTPTPTPTPAPGGDPAPEPTPSPEAAGCDPPLPPPLAQINVNIHLRGSDAWTLDSTPIVKDAAFCAKIGFTDGRSMCPVRPEGHPQRSACELYAVGRAKDNHRPGPTWYFEGHFCTGPPSGCMNHPDNQYQLKIYVGGTFSACAQNGVCGEVMADR